MLDFLPIRCIIRYNQNFTTDTEGVMANDDKLELARCIIDNHVDRCEDYNRGSTDYYCFFCDSNTITRYENEDHTRIPSKINHEPKCPVMIAKKVVRDHLKSGK